MRSRPSMFRWMSVVQRLVWWGSRPDRSGAGSVPPVPWTSEDCRTVPVPLQRTDSRCPDHPAVWAGCRGGEPAPSCRPTGRRPEGALGRRCDHCGRGRERWCLLGQGRCPWPGCCAGTHWSSQCPAKVCARPSL